MLRSIGFLVTSFISIFASDIITIKGGIYTIPSSSSFYIKDFKEKTIKIDSFKIDKYEVTNKEFGKKNIPVDEINYPVTSVSYKKAIQYCQKKSGTLPTNQQWIVASSFEDDKFYPYSTKKYPIKDENNINIIEERAIELEIDGFGAELDLVDTKDALIGNNGLVGMLGNVWEMTKNKTELVTIKGGSFYNIESFDILDNRVENKVLKTMLVDYEHIGFRCVYKK